MAPKPRKAFRDPVVSAPKARSGLKRRGKNTIKSTQLQTNQKKRNQTSNSKVNGRGKGKKSRLNGEIDDFEMERLSVALDRNNDARTSEAKSFNATWLALQQQNRTWRLKCVFHSTGAFLDYITVTLIQFHKQQFISNAKYEKTSWTVAYKTE